MGGSTVSNTPLCTMRTKSNAKIFASALPSSSEKRAKIIPAVVGVVESLRPAGAEPFIPRHIPGKCPVCGGGVARDPAYAAWRCENLQCPAQATRRVEFFAARGAMDIESVGGIVADKLVERGLVREPLDLFALPEEKLAVLNLGTDDAPRIYGAKNAAKACQAIARAKTAPLSRWLFGLALGDRQNHRRPARGFPRHHPGSRALAASAAMWWITTKKSETAAAASSANNREESDRLKQETAAAAARLLAAGFAAPSKRREEAEAGHRHRDRAGRRAQCPGFFRVPKPAGEILARMDALDIHPHKRENYGEEGQSPHSPAKRLF